MRRVRRVCAEYAQIFFPGSAAGIPGTLASLGNLGSAAGIPWSAPGVSERISKRPSQARPWGVHKRTRPNEAVHGKRLRKRNRLGTEQSQTHLHREFVYSKVDAVTVCQAECYLMVSSVTSWSMGRAQGERSPKGRYGYLSRSARTI